MSAAVSLFRLLENCEREGLAPPKETAKIVATPDLVELLARRIGVPFNVALETLAGIPVKEARAIATWAAAIPAEERIGALRNRARRRAERRKA